MAIVAVLGLGEAGSLLARDLVAGGATVRGFDPNPHGDLRDIPLVASTEAAVAGADVVISVNWATAAVEVARTVAPLIGPSAIFADHNTAGPALKERLDDIIEPTGARFVDVAMMAPVPGLGMRVGMFLAGPGAEDLAAFYRGFGTPATVVGTRAGDANARKLTRSIFFKGMSSAVWEALEAARAVGVEDWLYGDIAATFANANAAFIERIVEGTAKHAVRRAHEMRDAEAMCHELHTPATMATATAESLERIAHDARIGHQKIGVTNHV